MIALALLRRFWFLIPVCGIVVWIIFLMHERDAARAQVVQLRGNLAAVTAANTAAIKRAEHDKQQADAAYKSSSDAAVLLGNALADGVRDYENRLRARAVPPTGQPVAATGVDPIPEAIARALDACARDAARLQNAVDWATELKHDGPAFTRP